MRLASLLAVSSVLGMAAVAPAQQTSLTDLMQGRSVPLTMLPSAIPQGYMAVKLKAGSEGGLMDMMGGPFAMIFGMMGSMGGEGGSPELGPMLAMEISWTKGETVAMGGSDFLVTYKIDMNPMMMGNLPKEENALQKLPLKLTLVRMSAIQTLSPQPDLTPAKFMEMLKQSPKPPTPPTEEEEEVEPPPPTKG